jgi:hypothetical protein
MRRDSPWSDGILGMMKAMRERHQSAASHKTIKARSIRVSGAG